MSPITHTHLENILLMLFKTLTAAIEVFVMCGLSFTVKKVVSGWSMFVGSTGSQGPRLFTIHQVDTNTDNLPKAHTWWVWTCAGLLQLTTDDSCAVLVLFLKCCVPVIKRKYSLQCTCFHFFAVLVDFFHLQCSWLPENHHQVSSGTLNSARTH